MERSDGRAEAGKLNTGDADMVSQIRRCKKSVSFDRRLVGNCYQRFI